MTPPWDFFGRRDAAKGSSSSHATPGEPTNSAGPSNASDTPPATGQTQRQQTSNSNAPEPHRMVVKNRTISNKVPPKKKTHEGLIPQYHRRYALDWKDLRKWLEDHFAGIEFEKEYVRFLKFHLSYEPFF